MSKKSIIALVICMIMVAGCGKKEAMPEPREEPVQMSVDDNSIMDKEPVQLNPIRDEFASAEVAEGVVEKTVVEDKSNIIVEGHEDEPATEEQAVITETDRSTAEDLDIEYLANNLSMPESYVVSISITMEGSAVPLAMITGSKDNYQLVGISDCIVWESDNGTFFKSGSDVYNVETNGSRFSQFNDEEEESDFVPDALNDGPSAEDIESMEYHGIQNIQGKDCYVIVYTATDDDGTQEPVYMYVSCDDCTVAGISCETDEGKIDGVIYDYDEYVADLESKVSKSISLEDAESQYQNKAFSAMFMMMGAAMSGDIESE